ncbi:MAG: hypothetical protein ABR540_13480 [Acidimicrobiales bacterium]
MTTACGQVTFRSQQLACRSCDRRFAPAAELLSRTSDRIFDLEERFPIARLPLHAERRLPVRMIPQSGRRYIATVSWIDEQSPHTETFDLAR